MTDAALATLLEPHSTTIREVFGALRALTREVMPDAEGKRIRHVKCRSLDDAARAALRALLAEQAALRRPAG